MHTCTHAHTHARGGRRWGDGGRCYAVYEQPAITSVRASAHTRARVCTRAHMHVQVREQSTGGR